MLNGQINELWLLGTVHPTVWKKVWWPLVRIIAAAFAFGKGAALDIIYDVLEEICEIDWSQVRILNLKKVRHIYYPKFLKSKKVFTLYKAIIELSSSAICSSTNAFVI